MTAHNFQGKCHCGNVEISFSSQKDESDFTPRACSCSFCRHHGASYISDPDGAVEVTIDDASHINYYQFGHKTAHFMICQNCGVIMMALCDIDGNRYAVLNINTMLDHNFTGDDIITDFEGEDLSQRLKRRAKNWIPHVVIKNRT